MSVAHDTSVLVRIADLSAQALAQDGAVKTEEFLAACSEVLPIVGQFPISYSGTRAGGRASDLNVVELL